MRLLFPIVISLLRPAAAEVIPSGPTPAAKLSTKAFQHHEVLRIDRDFGMEQWEIALDGWLPAGRDGHIQDVRLWWVNTDDADRRKPFNAVVRRYFEFGYERKSESTLAVRMAGDRKEYLFTVRIDGGGTPAVFADVTLQDGSTVSRCRCDRGRLIARRVLGIPVGIAELKVQCTDESSQSHEGAVPYREIESSGSPSPE